MFGDRVKLKVAIPEGQTGGPLPAGTVGIVVEVDTSSAKIPEAFAVVLEGVEDRLYFAPDEVTIDLAWRTPREAAIASRLASVLHAEGVAKTDRRTQRIVDKLLAAYVAGIKDHERAEARRAEVESAEAEAEGEAP